MPLNINANELNLYQQVDKNKKDIEEIKNSSSSVKVLAEKVTQLETNYKSEYHLIEVIEYNLPAISFNNVNKSVTLENVNFKLSGSLISWAPVGDIENVNNISESLLVLLEQTEEGKITFKCENIPVNDLRVKVVVNLLGNY